VGSVVKLSSMSDIDHTTRTIRLLWIQSLVAHRDLSVIPRSDIMTSDRTLVRPKIGLVLPQW
jgi:hypothetical protein